MSSVRDVQAMQVQQRLSVQNAGYDIVYLVASLQPFIGDTLNDYKTDEVPSMIVPFCISRSVASRTEREH